MVSASIFYKTSVLAQNPVIYMGVMPDSVKKWLLVNTVLVIFHCLKGALKFVRVHNFVGSHYSAFMVPPLDC